MNYSGDRLICWISTPPPPQWHPGLWKDRRGRPGEPAHSVISLADSQVAYLAVPRFEVSLLVGDISTRKHDKSTLVVRLKPGNM